uniref:Putative secreted protein n=1 Tax=Psorophora albipes TaxID=869069 RepID=T1DJ50_9DIPT
MTVDLLGLAVLLQQATQHTHAVHPQQLLGHTGVGRTLPLAVAAVTSLAAGQCVLADAETRVHHDGLLDDQTVLDQLADALAGVGVSNLVDFIRIQPDLLLAASHNRGC